MGPLNWRRQDADQFVRDVQSHTAFPLIAGGAPTIEELEARNAEIRERFKEIDAEFAGKRMAEESAAEWRDLKAELKENEELADELRGRLEFIRSVAGEEHGSDSRATERGATFSTPRSRGGENIWDLYEVRRQSSGPEDEARKLNENAKRALEQSSIPHVKDEARAKDEVSNLMARFGAQSNDGQTFARHILATGSPTYSRAFGKALAGAPLSSEEQRALSLTGANGGYTVPYTLDPTIIKSSNYVANPLRRIARNIQIVGNEWRGVSSDGITASYGAELTQASDNAPTLAQPTANVEKAQAFVPFSIEIGEDWSGLQAELADLLADAKDVLEATKFLSGAGHGSNEPEGLLTGATGTVAGGSATYAVANLYALEEALGPRFRANGQFVASRFYYNKIRQLDTNGGANLWLRLPDGLENNAAGNTGATLLGYPANELSTMSTSLANGQTVAVFGDFSKFAIVDRIGMSIEVIPHLFGASGRPLGQRGIYAHWRNTSKVLTPNAFVKQIQTA